MALGHLVSAGLAALAVATAPLPATNLLTEYMENPIVLDIAAPRFYWLPNHVDRGITQKAYRLQVNCTTTGQTVWDSGVIASSQTTHVAYAGQPLISDAVYTWTVQWTDSNGATSAWSQPAFFGTGLMTQAEWAPAAWIGCPLHTGSNPNYNQLRAEFNLALPQGVTVTQARLYITSVGYYSVRVNGDWAEQWGTPRPRLDPGWTTYEVRSLYNAYDVTRRLVAGPNAIAVMLGNGWPDIDPVPGNNTYASTIPLDENGYPSSEALIEARLSGKMGEAKGLAAPVPNSGENREMRMQLHVRTSDGNTAVWVSTAGSFESVASKRTAHMVTKAHGRTYLAPNGGWMCGAGALLDDNVYNGCTYDARLETTGWDLPGYGYNTGTGWTNAVLFADPGGAHPTTMTAQTFPSITPQQEMPAQSMQSPSPGVYVFDLGQNIAGYVRLTLPAPVPAGITIVLRHAEVLQHPPYGPKDGNIYVGNLRSAKATDTYTTKGTAAGGDAEIFEPMFTYHGFRYIELTGWPYPPTLDMVVGVYSRTGVAHAGNVAFPYTANTLNQLQHAVTWGIGCNLMAVVSDCPQRDERKGWMGDSGLSLLPTHYNYAMGAMYTFWAMNIRDSQVYKGDTHPVGSVPDTVPHTFGSYPSDPAWGTAYPGVVYSTWRFLGDTRIAADHYPNLALYITFMAGQVNKTGIVNTYQSYGDWCPPPPQLNGGQGPKPPHSYTSAVAFLVDLQRMVELATALGYTADAAQYATYRATLVSQFNAGFLNAASGIYGNQNGDGLQTANAAAIGINAAQAAGANALSAVASALTHDISVTHSDATGPHWVTGIIGMRFLHPALTAIGQGKLAIDTLLQTSYPSYGWEFNHPDEPATTLWELPDGPTEGPGMNSRNHHMFASVGGWLYHDLAGIDQPRQFTSAYNPADPTQHGYKHAILFPRVTDHPSVPFVEAEYNSIAGTYAITWTNPNNTASGNTCVQNAPENAPVTISCPGQGVVTSVVFASFGTPSGMCGAFQKGTCDAANSTAIVTQACMGKNSCTINVADTLFGDPCYDTVKVLDAQVQCSTTAGITIEATVPTNAQATVRIPFAAGVDPNSVVVTEGTTTIWQKGAFVPGAAPGVLSANISTVDVPAGTAMTLDVVVGSGVYALATAQ